MTEPPESTPVEGAATHRRWHPLRYVRVRPRLMTSTVIFVVVGTLLALGGTRTSLAMLLAFDVGALLYLIALARMFTRSNHGRLARQARLQDTGRHATLAVAVLVSMVVLVALATELHAAKAGGVAAIGVAAGSVILSWLFMNTTFALHYAHSFYGEDDSQAGGLEFPSTPKPDYWDFVYFSFVIGMCFQTSDVTVSGRHMRRLTLMHSVVAFFFNVFILAISVSVVGGLG
ncbi:DUF1345 domain-containing protein [Rhodanobacter sp. 115]|uniref:DUF1345 domain-containing protein n=1 Tax=Rhodanobacter sp. FW021-MT20 TaxID=1162282 RepID=UPI000260D697|nr:DUF1345 domain-containing protein [Rhodanobacter sp. 115]EIL98115.1 hypothetical protein UU5_04159 [Rhodanobacter sp. 115]